MFWWLDILRYAPFLWLQEYLCGPLRTNLCHLAPVLFLLYNRMIFSKKKKLLEYSCFTMLLASAVQQSESALLIHVSPLLKISFPFRSPQSIGYSSLWRCSLVTCFIHSSIYMSPSFPVHPTATLYPLLYIHVFSTCVSLFCFADRFICTIFIDSI